LDAAEQALALFMSPPLLGEVSARFENPVAVEHRRLGAAGARVVEDASAASGGGDLGQGNAGSKEWRPGPDLPTGESPDPVRDLGLPGCARRSLSVDEVRVVRAHAAVRLRALRDELRRVGVGRAEQARILWSLRNAVVLWTRELMCDQRAAERSRESTRTFDDWVAELRPKFGDSETYRKIVLRAVAIDSRRKYAHLPPLPTAHSVVLASALAMAG
jgi:hypothetical protein